MKIGNTEILTKTVAAGTNTIAFSDTELDNIYKLYGSSKTLTAAFILTTAGTYTDSKTCTITLTGNQKTGWVKVDDVWKRCKKWVNVNGTWKRCVRWIKVDGSWKRCI